MLVTAVGMLLPSGCANVHPVLARRTGRRHESAVRAAFVASWMRLVGQMFTESVLLSGHYEIYVRPFPGGSGGKWQVSGGGGLDAFWANNGRELFYETADSRIMVVDYTVNGASFVPGKPRLWSDRQLLYTGTSNLDLAPDGKRFAVLTLPETPAGIEKGTVHVTVLLNFFDEVRRRIP